MEIEVGEYVRTKDGFIDRIDSFNINTNIYHCENGLCIDTENKIAVHLKNVKHSKNIIDLIEVGDYVNGYYVRATYLEGPIKYIKLDNNSGIRTYEENIKSILTHEQFEANAYKVKGE